MLIDKVKETIKKRAMLGPGDRVALAVSGGIDSAVMLDVLLRLSKDMGFDLVAVCHVEHGLRGESSKSDMEFVRTLAKASGLEFISKIFSPGELDSAGDDGGSLQSRAREARYSFFEEVLGELSATRVALGHNLDDQAETVMMRLLKGSGLKGLSAIPPRRGPYIRPLIDISRAEIEEYAAERKIDFVEDETNSEEKYLRNRLRLKLMPLLAEEYNPSIKEGLASVADMARRDNAFIDALAVELFEEVLIEDNETSLVLDRKRLKEADLALSSRALFIAAKRLIGESANIYQAHVEAFLSLVESERPNATLDLSAGLYALREYERVEVGLGSPPAKAEALGFVVELRVPGLTDIPGSSARLKAEIVDGPALIEAGEDTALFDLAALDMPLFLRLPREGDRMKPLGMEGTRKLKDIFIDKKVPPAERKRTPLVTSGEDILWVAGLRRASGASVDADTEKLLKLQLLS